MTLAVLIAPKVGTKSASRAALAQRSRREPNTLFVSTTTGLLARGGTIERVAPMLFKLIATLASAPGGCLSNEDCIAALWGHLENGGPTTGLQGIDVRLCEYSDNLAALGIDVVRDSMLARRLVSKTLSRRGAPTEIVPATRKCSNAHWLPQARAMRERGATFKAIGIAVGRSASTVGQAFSGRRYDGAISRSTTASLEARRRGHLRQDARAEARRTGEPVEQIYTRWGCETVSRSRLWDQRHATTTLPTGAQ